VPDGRRFRAVVADDEPVARAAVLTLLADQPAVEVVGEAGSGEETVGLVRRLRPDLLFLDVQMPGGDGFRVLESLGPDVPRGVVFVTAFDEHAVRAFEVHALDYVVKPFGRPRFDAAVARAVARLEAEEALTLRRTLEALVEGRRTSADAAGTLAAGGPASLAAGGPASPPAAARPENLAVRVGSRTVIVPVGDVDWIESDGDYARIHAAGKAHLVSARMHALEELLDGSRFLRVHRSVIVNLARVAELQREDDGGGSVVLRSGVRLRVARGRWDELEKALAIV
jgi:two-component system, LytTR family, response regulator